MINEFKKLLINWTVGLVLVEILIGMHFGQFFKIYLTIFFFINFTFLMVFIQSLLLSKNWLKCINHGQGRSNKSRFTPLGLNGRSPRLDQMLLKILIKKNILNNFNKSILHIKLCQRGSLNQLNFAPVQFISINSILSEFILFGLNKYLLSLNSLLIIALLLLITNGLMIL